MARRKEKTLEDLLQAMCISKSHIGSHFYALATYLTDPHNFYIIPADYVYHLKTLSKPGDHVKPEDLKENTVIVFKSENPDVNKYLKEFDAHIRGVIQNIGEDNKCDIYALDRGFVETDVPLDRIFHTGSDEALNIPSLILHCELFSCSPVGPNFNQESIEAFKYYMGNEKLSIVVHNNSTHKLKVVVYNSCPDDIATLLALTNFTYLAASIHIFDDRSIDYSSPELSYQHIDISVGDILNVRVQSGTSLNEFYVTPMSTYKQYLRIRADFTNFCKTVPQIVDKDFKSGTIVGVHDDSTNFYERAIILEVVDSEKARVKLVDWGTEFDVCRNRIKALKTGFYLKSPAYAMYCSAIDGFKPWDNGLQNFLYKGYIFTIKVTRLGKGFESPHVVAIAKAKE